MSGSYFSSENSKLFRKWFVIRRWGPNWDRLFVLIISPLSFIHYSSFCMFYYNFSYICFYTVLFSHRILFTQRVGALLLSGLWGQHVILRVCCYFWHPPSYIWITSHPVLGQWCLENSKNKQTKKEFLPFLCSQQATGLNCSWVSMFHSPPFLAWTKGQSFRIPAYPMSSVVPK